MKRCLLLVLAVPLLLCLHSREAGRSPRPPQPGLPWPSTNVAPVSTHYTLLCENGPTASREFGPGLRPIFDLPPGEYMGGTDLALVPHPELQGKFLHRYRGMGLTLVNNASEKRSIPVADFKLYLMQEARDLDGKWRRIERAPFSGCGNSYFSVALPPRSYWQFVAPRFEGSLETEFRFVLVTGKNSRVYSEVFEGSINPELLQGNQNPSDGYLGNEHNSVHDLSVFSRMGAKSS